MRRRYLEAEIETDKATMEFESQEDGFMAKIVVPDGTNDVPVGTVVAVMVEEQEHVAAFANYAAPPVTDAASGVSASSVSVAPASERRVDSSGGRMWPSVRRLLIESGLDPLTITPTGPRGALVKLSLIHI